MKRTVHVVFDGEVLRPDEPLDLVPNGRYRVIVESVEDEQPAQEPGMLDDIVELVEDLDLPPDFAQQHDHYLYGTPKR